METNGNEEEDAQDAQDEEITQENGERKEIRYRVGDGEWRTLGKVEPKRTGDEELDALWAMSMEELQEILENEHHPLHEKSKQVSREMMQPIREAVNALNTRDCSRFRM